MLYHFEILWNGIYILYNLPKTKEPAVTQLILVLLPASPLMLGKLHNKILVPSF